MAPVDLVQRSVEFYVFWVNLSLSLQEEYFSLCFFFQGIGNGFSVLVSTDDFGSESFFSREFEQLIFPDIFGMVEISKELSLVLNIASDEGRVGVDLSDLILCGNVVLFRVSISMVVVLNWGGKEKM